MRITHSIAALFIYACVSFARADENDTNNAVAAAVADIATTVVALNASAVELNPLGVSGALIAKGVVIAIVREFPEPKKKTVLKLFSASWWGASINNLCTIASGGSCLLVGAIGGVTIWFLNREPPEVVNQAIH